MEIIFKSLLAAVITAIVLLIAKFSGPRLAGAIAGIPIVFAVSYVLITMADKSASREFLVGGIYGAIAAILFSVVLIWLNYQFPKYHWVSFTVAYAVCFVFALSLAHFTTAK